MKIGGKAVLHILSQLAYPRGKDGCWLWVGERNGMIPALMNRETGTRRPVPIAHILWTLERGPLNGNSLWRLCSGKFAPEELPPVLRELRAAELRVLCCNPYHMRLDPRPPGCAYDNPAKKLSKEQILYIHATERTDEDLAAEFKMAAAVIRRIRAGAARADLKP